MHLEVRQLKSMMFSCSVAKVISPQPNLLLNSVGWWLVRWEFSSPHLSISSIDLGSFSWIYFEILHGQSDLKVDISFLVLNFSWIQSWTHRDSHLIFFYFLHIFSSFFQHSYTVPLHDSHRSFPSGAYCSILSLFGRSGWWFQFEGWDDLSFQSKLGLRVIGSFLSSLVGFKLFKIHCRMISHSLQW